MTELDVGQLRVPPHSIEAEQSVLGGLLLDNSAWDRAGDILSDSDFYRWEHSHIYAAIGALITANKPADIITVYEQLQRLGKAEECGGMVYLNALAQSVPSAANMRRYAEIVRERAILRQLIAASDRIATAAFNPQGRQLADVVDEAVGLISRVQARDRRKAAQRLADVLTGRLDHMDAVARGEAAPGWPTGFTGLDSAVLMTAGMLLLLAARPSVGKTSFALEIARRFATSGLPVVVFSMEMSAAELADRFLAAVGGVDHSALRRGTLANDDWERTSYAADAGARLPLYIVDQPALRLADIRAQCRAIPGVQIAVIDYLQLMGAEPGTAVSNRNAQLEVISRGLKAIARDLGILIIALSQLNRAVESRADPRPTLGDLRDSGALEQDADAVLGAWRVRTFGSGQQVIGLAALKNRGGACAEIGYRFDPRTQRWTEDSEIDLRPARAAAPSHGGGFE